MLFRFEIGRQLAGSPLSSPCFFNSGVTEATMKRDGNMPSRNDNAASLAMSGAKISEQDFGSDVGILSTIDDFPGVELRMCLTSSTVGGKMSL